MEKSKRNLILILFAYLVLYSILYIGLPMSEDESNIYYVSEKWNEGHTPYKDYSGDSKTPGMYYYTSAVLSFTDSIQALRFGALMANMLSAVLVYLICNILFSDRKTVKSTLAAALFMVINLMPGMNGYFFQVDRLFVLFSLASVYFFLKHINLLDSKKYAVAAGLAAGIALVFKQLAITLPLLFVIFFLYLIITKQKQFKKVFLNGAILIGGFAIPVVLVILHFSLIGGLDSMIYWAVNGVTNQYNTESIFLHPETINSLARIYQFSVMAPFWLASLVVSLVFIVKLFKNKISRSEMFLLLWLISTLHVMVLLLAFQASQFAPLAIMTAVFFVDFKPPKNSAKKYLTYTIMIFMIFLSLSVNIYSEYNLQTTRKAFYQQEIDAAKYIKDHTVEGEAIYMFGYRPSIFILSNRDPPPNAPVLANFNIQVKGVYENVTIMILKEQKINYIIHETMTKPEDAPVLFDYIQNNYKVETTIGRFVIYKRNQ